MPGGSCNNDSFPNFNIDPYYSCSFLHSPPLMYYEMDNGFLINNEDQHLKVIQQTDELIMKTSDHDFHTSSLQIKASNSISNLPAALVQAAADAASANNKKIDLDNSSDVVNEIVLVEDGVANTGAAAATTTNYNISSIEQYQLQQLPAAAASSSPCTRRWVSKRDRHSKINTAQGPRDRRVRLSLDVAHDFFKLQDMLGFDKPSRTVNWLLMQSEPAIQNLIMGKTGKESQSPRSCNKNNNSASSISECYCGDGQLEENANALISGHDDEITTTINRQAVVSAALSQHQHQHQHQSPPAAAGNYKHHDGRSRQKQSTRSTPLASTTLANESRKKARYRARKRTEEKMESRRRLLLQFDHEPKLVGIKAARGMINNNTDELVMMQQYHQNNLQLHLAGGSFENKIAVEEYSGGSVSQNMKKMPLGGEVQSAESIDQTSLSDKVHHGLCGGSSLALAENWSPLAAFYRPPHNEENYNVPCQVTELHYHGTSWDDYGHPNLY